MKKLLLVLILLLPSFLSVKAQLPQLVGTTLYKTPIYSIDTKESIERIPGKIEVNIIDTNDKFFTIIYQGNKVLIEQNDVKCNSKDLREFENKIALLKENGTFQQLIKEVKLNSELTIIAKNITSNQKIEDPLKFEIDHIRYCAGKYNGEVMTGYLFTMAGSVITGIGAFTDEPEVPIAIGAGMGLLGTILIIDSQKWMRKLYVGPNGIGIKYKF